jgi:hypothetical protein
LPIGSIDDHRHSIVNGRAERVGLASDNGERLQSLAVRRGAPVLPER